MEHQCRWVCHKKMNVGDGKLNVGDGKLNVGDGALKLNVGDGARYINETAVHVEICAENIPDAASMVHSNAHNSF
jgi:hypothetical protein